jgi:hypothetical protein
VELAAAAVTIEHSGRDVQRYRGDDPDLPMGEQPADRKFVGYAEIRRQAPEAQHVGHQRGGDQQRAGGQSDLAVLATRSAQRVTLA